jgi:cell division protein FtsB
MKNFEIKKKIVWWQTSVALFVFGVILVLFFISLVGIIKKNKQAKELRDKYLQELQQLESQEVELANQLEYLNTPRGKEDAFRDQYPISQSGEELIIIVDEKRATDQ